MLGEVYVIDSQSTDETVSDCASLTARRSCSSIIRVVGPRNASGRWIRCRCRYDWVFLVDADEALTPELAEEIRKAIERPAYDGYLHRLANVFSGTRIAPQRREFLQAFAVPPRKGAF